MVNKLGPIILLVLSCGAAAAQEPHAVTIRLFSDVQGEQPASRDFAWNAEMQAPRPMAPPAARPAITAPRPAKPGPIGLLLSLAELL